MRSVVLPFRVLPVLAFLFVALGVLGPLAPAGEARAGVDESAPSFFCIYGDGDGQGWTWTITAENFMGDPDSFSGAVAGVTGSAFDVRNRFVDSIEAAPKGDLHFVYARKIPPPADCVPTPAAAFVIVGTYLLSNGPPTLFIEPVGGGAEVEVVGPDISAAIDFNPKIWVLPEPGRTALLGAGGLVVLGLSRVRRRTSRAERQRDSQVGRQAG